MKLTSPKTSQSVSQKIQQLLPELQKCRTASDRFKLEQKFLQAQSTDEALSRIIQEKILEVVDSGDSNAYHNGLGFITYRLGSYKDEITNYFANLRLHIYAEGLKKPEFLMLPHDHGWEYVSFTKFGSILHSIWSLTKQATQETYKKYVLVYTNKNQTEKAGMLDFLSTVYLKLLREREVSQGQAISMTKGALHSVKATDGTVTILLNYGHPDNSSHFLYPQEIEPSRDLSDETSFSFQKLPKADAVSGMLSLLIDRLGQEPPSCPIEKID